MIKLSMDLQNEELPTVPQVIYEYLEQTYDMDFMLSKTQLKNNDEIIGYMRGVRDVLTNIRRLAHIDDDKE